MNKNQTTDKIVALYADAIIGISQRNLLDIGFSLI